MHTHQTLRMNHQKKSSHRNDTYTETTICNEIQIETIRENYNRYENISESDRTTDPLVTVNTYTNFMIRV